MLLNEKLPRMSEVLEEGIGFASQLNLKFEQQIEYLPIMAIFDQFQ